MKKIVLLALFLAFVRPAQAVSVTQTITIKSPHAQIKTTRRQKQQKPAPRAVHLPSPRSVASGVFETMICKVFGKDCAMAIAIARCESGLRPNAVSPTNDHGLFQINAVHTAKFAGRSPYDPEANIEVAHQIYQVQGWGPWTVYHTGCYKAFL